MNRAADRSLIIRGIRVTIGMLFGMTAFLKAWDVQWCAVTMSHILPFMRQSVNALLLAATVVILWEIMLGWALVTASHLRVAVWCTLGTTIAFSSILIMFWFDGDAPRCGCAGFLSAYGSWWENPGVGLIRNGLIILGLHEIIRHPSESAGSPIR